MAKPCLRAIEMLRRIADVPAPVGAELGVWRGRMSRALLRGHRGLKLFMVDGWSGHGADYLGYTEDKKVSMNDITMVLAYWRAWQSTIFAFNRRTLYRDRTDRAAARFADQSLDFAFIDADHSYEGCKADIDNYWPKVKAGGWLCGHDYGHPVLPGFGVKRAVDEFAQHQGLSLELGDDHTWFTRKPF